MGLPKHLSAVYWTERKAQQEYRMKDTTVEEWLRAQLEQRGVWTELEDVISAVKNLKETRSIQWDSLTGDYPDVFFGALLMTAGKAALDYIDEHYPKAFYRSLVAELVPG